MLSLSIWSSQSLPDHTIHNTQSFAAQKDSDLEHTSVLASDESCSVSKCSDVCNLYDEVAEWSGLASI